MKKNILVTGGAGYIGSKVTFDLCDKGHNVFIVDNLTTGFRKLVDKRAKFYNLDILETFKLNEIIKKNKIDTIFHFAASLSVEESMKSPLKYYINNVEGTRSLINAAKKNVKYFIFSSTCAIYNPKNIKEVNENSEINPLSHYGKTKHLSELMIQNANTGFKYIILRYFNVAGSDSKSRQGCVNQNGQLIKNLVTNIRKKKYQIDVFGNDYKTYDGTCIRDYIHVEDLSKIHIKALEYLIEKKKSTILNCGYGKGYSVLEIIKEVEKIIKKKIKINFKKRRRGDCEKVIADTKKLRSKFNIKFNKNRIKNIIQTALIWEKFNANK